ncbi:hypothetical protein PMIN03_007612 [Paraphaeosphaeria minitans]
MGRGKSQLLSKTDAAAAEQGQANASTNVNVNASASQGVPNNPVQSGSGGNETSNQSSGQAAGSGEVEYKKVVPSKDFSEEEDRILMRMKTEDQQWGEIMKHMNGKSKKQCTQRFNEIRPDDFYEKKKAAKGNSKGGQQGNQKDQKQDNKAQDKKEENTAEAAGDDGWDPMAALVGVFGDDSKSNASEKGTKKDGKPGDTAWSNTGNDWTAVAAGDKDNNAGGATGWTDGANDNSGHNGGADWNDTGNGGVDSGGGAATINWEIECNKSKSSSSHASKTNSKNPWGADGDDGAADTGQAQNFGAADWVAATSFKEGKSSKGDDPKKKAKSSDPTSWNNGWDAPPFSPRKAVSRASSKDRQKHCSSHRRSGSKESRHSPHHHHSISHPTEYKVAPDNTFSQDELKLIARILQQDCSMVWERVSWRFKDKTGRNLDSDVFEKKITGSLEKERRH